jgi:hypothetical protein
MTNNGDGPDDELSIGYLVEQYIGLRDRVKAIKARHSAELAPYADAMALVENACLERLTREGGDHIGTPAGTVYKKVDTRVAINDWELLFQFIWDNQAWHFLTRDVSKEAVVNFLAETKELPPGVSMSRTLGVNVRRGRNTRPNGPITSAITSTTEQDTADNV